MAVQVRRVVTGHDASGRAVVKIDEVSKNIISSRPGQTACVVWTTESFPVNNTSDADEGLEAGRHDTEERDGFSCREFGPGVAPRNHRTDSIDYAVVMSGEIDMELTDSVVHLKAGDVLVARNDPQLGQPRHPALCDGFRPDRLQASRGRREGPECRRIIRFHWDV